MKFNAKRMPVITNKRLCLTITILIIINAPVAHATESPDRPKTTLLTPPFQPSSSSPTRSSSDDSNCCSQMMNALCCCFDVFIILASICKSSCGSHHGISLRNGTNPRKMN